MNISLENIHLGAVSERFNDELVKVIENILDENTDGKAKRKIRVELIISPNPENRETCGMEAKISSALAPTKTLISQLTVGMDLRTGEVDAIEHVAHQKNLFPETEEKGSGANIRQMRG